MNDTCNMCVHFVPTTCLVGRIRLDFKSSFWVHWEMVIRQRFCFLYIRWTWGLKSSSKLSFHIMFIYRYTLTGSGNNTNGDPIMVHNLWSFWIGQFSLKVNFLFDLNWSLQRDYISVVNYSRTRFNLNLAEWTQKSWYYPNFLRFVLCITQCVMVNGLKVLSELEQSWNLDNIIEGRHIHKALICAPNNIFDLKWIEISPFSFLSKFINVLRLRLRLLARAISTDWIQ